jgi:hypothetical protein
MSHARSAGRRVELIVVSAPAAFIAAIKASQPERKSLESVAVVPASGNRATHCAPLDSFAAGAIIKPPLPKGRRHVGPTLRLYHAKLLAKSLPRETFAAASCRTLKTPPERS